MIKMNFLAFFLPFQGLPFRPNNSTARTGVWDRIAVNDRFRWVSLTKGAGQSESRAAAMGVGIRRDGWPWYAIRR